MAKRVAQLLLSKGSSVPFGLSLVAHAGLVVVAANHLALSASTSPAPSEIELSGTDPAQNETEASPQSAPVGNAALRNAALRSETRLATYREPTASSRPSALQPVAAASVSASAESDGPRFVMVVARATAQRSELPSAKEVSTGAIAGQRAPVAESVAETPARLRMGNPPAYTAAALSAGVEADVPLEIVVSEAGAVISARGLVHVGYGLDEAAVESVRGYRFTAAVHDGKAVSVRMKWLVRFQLR
jgi:TonB family protein